MSIPDKFNLTVGDGSLLRRRMIIEFNKNLKGPLIQEEYR